MEISALIEALALPSAYPFPVSDIEVRQTHISAVFLAGPYVYKVKKPVNLGFLDFSTLERRLHFCEQEVRLNRRLAPDVYLGVVPVVQTPQGCRFEGVGEAIDWAVKMQRLSDAATLRDQLRFGDVRIEVAEELARRIAAFHKAAETNARIAAFGGIEPVSRLILDIFDQAIRQIGTTVTERVFARTQYLARQALQLLAPLIHQRSARSMTRDCHGDLHLDHVYLFPGKAPPADLVIIDCIEFNERFRFIDPIADMAFPTMDFLFHGRRDLARAFTEAYFQASSDNEGRSLLPLYTAYRATVRGMVEGLLLTEKEAPEAERTAALERARAHWLLALTELEEPGRKPCLVLVAGLPGTGKSTLARGLAQSAGFEVIRSDVVRKELANLSSAGSIEGRPTIYTPEWNQRTYAECLRRAEQLVLDGNRVIIDATFREEASRRKFLDAAARWGVPAQILLCEVQLKTARARLEQRKGDVSDADWAVHRQLSETWEPAGPATRQVLRAISNEGSPEEAISQVLEELREVSLN